MKSTTRKQSYDIDAAEAVAFRAVAFVVSNDEYLADFARRSGVCPSLFPDMIENREFLVGILDHLLADESLLLAFCGNADIDPSDILPVRDALCSC